MANNRRLNVIIEMGIWIGVLRESPFINLYNALESMDGCRPTTGSGPN